MSEDRRVNDQETPIPVKVKPPENLIMFHDENNKRVGRLFFNEDGHLDFEGDATESATIMFQAFIKHVEDQLRERASDESK